MMRNADTPGMNKRGTEKLCKEYTNKPAFFAFYSSAPLFDKKEYEREQGAVMD